MPFFIDYMKLGLIFVPIRNNRHVVGEVRVSLFTVNIM